MPYIIRPKGARRIAAALFGAVLLACAAPAAASAACPSSSASPLLAALGDNALYTLLAGSSFESGAQGWQLTDAEVVSGEGAAEDPDALVIEPGGRAVSPQFCVSSEYPSFRFFARQLSGGRAGTLDVALLWTDVFGVRHYTPVAALAPNGEWTLSPVLGLASSLPLWMPGSTLNVRLQFEPSAGASWAIDDVYIDPYSR